MAEVNTDKGGDKGGKNKQKKVTLRVDFTPMVDMNMLLITFFMFCTSLSKPQTMEINMPSKDKINEGEENKVRESSAVTILLGKEDKVYYYLGMPTQEKYEDPDFLSESDYSAEGIRALLLEKNAGVNRLIKELKVKLQAKEITDEEFKLQSSEIKKEASKTTAPTVMIKPTDESNYKNLIDVLDEMQICNIAAYAIIELADGDRYMLFKKTNDPIYLTEAQRQEGGY
ncbi:MAG: biopolymer transporter ExbD [Dysgonamonadaceae bacterium]|jgi:biopolymer transport protein ExbD|nr:biopolymer transporter ExbD [Dysgonamonadaceae bacterium]